MWRYSASLYRRLHCASRKGGQRMGDEVECSVHVHTEEAVLGPMVSFMQSRPDPAVHSALSLRLRSSAFLLCKVLLCNKLFTYP